MKSIRIFFCLLFFLPAQQVFSQLYFGENELIISMNDKKKDWAWGSPRFQMRVDLERSAFSWQVDMPTFRVLDTLCPYNLFAIFTPANVPSLSFKSEFPFNSFNKTVSNWQPYQLQGSLAVGNRNYVFVFPIEFKLLDKQMLYRFTSNLDLQNAGIDLPTEYRDKLLAILNLQVSDGVLLLRSF